MTGFLKEISLSDHPWTTLAVIHSPPELEPRCFHNGWLQCHGRSLIWLLTAPPLTQLEMVSLLSWPQFSHSRVSDLWLLNLILVQQKNHSSIWCLQGGTPNKGNPEHFYLTVCVCESLPSSYWILGSCSALVFGFLAVATGPCVLCCAKRWQILASCLGVPPRVQPTAPSAAAPRDTCTKYVLQKLANSDPKSYIQWEISKLYFCSW